MELSYEAICFDLFGTLVEEDGRATEGARGALVTVPRERCAIVTSCGQQFAQTLLRTAQLPQPPKAGQPPPGPFDTAPPVNANGSGSIFEPAVYAEAEATPWRGSRIVPGIRVDYAKGTGAWDEVTLTRQLPVAETAIVMLADGVEASAHVLRDPTPKKIREVIDHIVRQRIEHGQLRQAPLTLQQVEVVKEQFARMMIGMYHHRIDYPSATGGVTSQFASDDTGETPVFGGTPPTAPPSPVRHPGDAPLPAAAETPAKDSGGEGAVNRESGLDAPVGAGTPAG